MKRLTKIIMYAHSDGTITDRKWDNKTDVVLTGEREVDAPLRKIGVIGSTALMDDKILNALLDEAQELGFTELKVLAMHVLRSLPIQDLRECGPELRSYAAYPAELTRIMNEDTKVYYFAARGSNWEHAPKDVTIIIR